MSNLRVRIASLLLCGFSLLSIFSAFTVRKSCSVLIALTETVLSADDPVSAIHALTDEWDKQYLPLHFFVPNQSLSDLNTRIMKLDALNTADHAALPAELHSIIAELQWLRHTELSVF